MRCLSVASIDPGNSIPAATIPSAWLVDADGKLTIRIEENLSYGPPKDDFAKLTEPDH